MKIIAACVVLILAIAVPSAAQELQQKNDSQERVGIWPYAAVLTAVTWDVTSTIRGTQRGATELNPLFGTQTKLILGQIAITTAVVIVMHKTHNKKAAKVAGYIFSGIHAGFAAHNEFVNR